MKNTDGILRVGGVGTGRIFQHAHLRPYPGLLAKARLVAFYDTNPARARQARDKYATMLDQHATEHPEAAQAAKANLSELRAHDTLEGLLRQVDAVDIATTTRGRMPSAIAAAQAGVHAMAEKPMARTWTEADRAARAFAGQPGVFFQLNDDNAFDPKYYVLHDLLAEGAIGRPQSMLLIRGSALSAPTVLKSQASALENGGGCLMDYGSHGLAGVWYALGLHYRLTRVEAIRIGVRFPHRVLEGDPHFMEVDDDAHVKFLFEDPETGSWVTVFMEATWSGGEIGLDREKPGGQSHGVLHLTGDEGVIEGSARDRLVVRRWDGGEKVYPLREYPGETVSFTDEIETFLDCVYAGTPPRIDLRFGAEVIAAIGAAYLSAIRKRAVTLDQFKAFCRGYLEQYGDNERADEAILADLLAPYQKGPRA